ncbi:MAG: hypothetical protein JW889_14450 [Verrucomicrobia bacterium]|nr:hypothetical protein [Verrucomicrobiota bacterium]
MPERTIAINRAPVLTLWAATVAEELGYDRDAALTLGKALAGLTAQTKGRSLGIFKAPKTRDGRPPKKVGLGEEFWVEICGRPVPAKNTEDGVRAVVKDKAIDPGGVEKYLAGKFGDDLDDVRAAMQHLAKAFAPHELADAAYSLYERFRPSIPPGKRGWGATGKLDLGLIRSLASVQ